MWFSSLRIFSVVSLFAICSTALPAKDAGVANQLEKRTPRDDAANAVRFEGYVSPSDQAKIKDAIRDMIDMATEAAQMDYRGIRRPMYTRWMPAGREDQVKSVFKHIAGINQVWGAVHLGQYDISRITITREKSSSIPFMQAETILQMDKPPKITIYDFGMQTKMRNAITPQSIGDYTSFRMEFLGAVLLHEMMHVPDVLTNTLCAPGAAAVNRKYCKVDDQKQDVGLGIKVKSYGPWLSKRLADHDVEQAFLNNDNYMYLALEAYWSVVCGKTSWLPPKIEVLPRCSSVIKNYMDWCWDR